MWKPRDQLTRITTAEFIKSHGSLADKALAEPVTITKTGRDHLVLVSAEECDRPKRRDRRAFRAEEPGEDDLALIAKAEHAHLDVELAGWRP